MLSDCKSQTVTLQRFKIGSKDAKSTRCYIRSLKIYEPENCWYFFYHKAQYESNMCLYGVCSSFVLNNKPCHIPL